MRLTKKSSFWPGNHRVLASLAAKKNRFPFSIFFLASSSAKNLEHIKVHFTHSHRTFLSLFYLQLDNVEACLKILRENSVPGIEHVTAHEIVGGRLKAVLSLFFSLSRYKQVSKLKSPNIRAQQGQQTQHSDMILAKER